jgi:hypothetical protein
MITKPPETQKMNISLIKLTAGSQDDAIFGPLISPDKIKLN